MLSEVPPIATSDDSSPDGSKNIPSNVQPALGDASIDRSPEAPTPTTTASHRHGLRKRPNPTTPDRDIPDGDLLAASLAPLTKKDLEQWKGWIEVESDPAFFNAILRDLGVKNVRAQEVLSLDNLATLGNTVFGLIFLSEYIENDENLMTECDNIWFANQTVENSCATVALLNLIMNAKCANLGETISKFREMTQPLDTITRGKYISQNTFLRSTHNQFASRMDILNADLALDNQTNTDSTGKRMIRNISVASKRQRRNAETSFHYVAFVKSEQEEVWELDGLRWNPVSLGKVGDASVGDSGANWLSLIMPVIESRMESSSSAGFSLLSFIEDPLWPCALEIAKSLATIKAIERHATTQTPSWDITTATPLTPLAGGNDEEALKLYKLTLEDIDNAQPEDQVLATLKQGMNKEGTLELREVCIGKVHAALSKWEAQYIQLDAETLSSGERNESFLPAIHEWTRVLAEIDKLKMLNTLASAS
ncbi:Ubiquitin carboxyl-terminal hydrolase isozyme L5 [Ceratocystis lukuohia]|uniref:ubiquitinyl hydrolase 1 n=1 Tax=Ceratocystis lukuohia TaxID=2019550 RepID=A0ABR4MNY3_9PEZI